MRPLIDGFVAGLGAIVGSFLNVVIWRMPRGEPFGMSRSRCPRCAGPIAAWDNIPILSYVLLRGRCRKCRQPISPRYPLVEALTAGLFLLTWGRANALGWTPPWLGFAVGAGFASILVAASFIDFDHKLLPDRLTLRAGPVVGLIGALGVPAIHGTHLFGIDLAAAMKHGLASLIVGLAGAIVGGGVILAIRQIGTWALKKEAMGLGDVKFMAMCGLLLGPGPTLLGIGVAMVAGAVLGILIWAITRNREIPFGPFLALGALATLFYGREIEHFVLVTWPTWVRGG